MLGLALKVAQIALGIGGVALLWMAVSPFARSQTPALPPPLMPMPPVDTRQAAGPRYEVIAQRNLFAPLQQPVKPEPPPVQKIEPTRLNARLLGTAITEVGGEVTTGSLAVVRDIDGEVVTVGVDDLLAGGAARVVAIEHRRIVIEHQGRLEAILLEDEDTSPGRSVRARASRPSIDRGAEAAAARMRAGMTSSGEMLSLMRNLRQLGRFAAERDADGNLSGIRITRLSEGSPLAELGVAVGDRVAAVNGISLTGDGAGVGVMASIATGGDPVLTVQDTSGRTREIAVPRSILDGLARGR